MGRVVSNKETICVDTIDYGCYVLIYIDNRRRFIVKVRENEFFETDIGKISFHNIVGEQYGSHITLPNGLKLYLLKPSFIDFIEKGFKRKSQVIYPKDHGMILVLLDIKPGYKVVEIGVGSGFTTALLAGIVGEEGRVYSYEIRRDMIEVAQKNLKKIGVHHRVILKNKDARLGIDERDIDAAIVDIPDPWSVVEALEEALKPSAGAIFFTPTTNQASRLLAVLESRTHWINTRVYEVMLREYEPHADALRPRTTMIAHTGYLVYSRYVV